MHLNPKPISGKELEKVHKTKKHEQIKKIIQLNLFSLSHKHAQSEQMKEKKEMENLYTELASESLASTNAKFNFSYHSIELLTFTISLDPHVAIFRIDSVYKHMDKRCKKTNQKNHTQDPC